ncbi:MAG TPA: transposase [Gammaproteobacteria bacterium]|nr:transposase [Gammaproteobacteria bacterium]
MPRKPRFYLPGIPVHVVQRGNDRQPVFFDDRDYARYLAWLRKGAEQCECAVHAYVLMTNHVHLLATPRHRVALSRMIQYVGRFYVSYVNREYGRSGTLWEGRHKGSLVSAMDYFLACSRYIELNPVRAGMVKAPEEYRWSSYRSNGLGQADGLLTPHELYLSLGRTAEERQYRYRELFRGALDTEQLDQIRAAVQTGTPLGNDRFKERIEQTLKRRVGHAKRGRPRKQND